MGGKVGKYRGQRGLYGSKAKREMKDTPPKEESAGVPFIQLPLFTATARFGFAPALLTVIRGSLSGKYPAYPKYLRVIYQ